MTRVAVQLGGVISMELDRSCEICLQQCNRTSSQRWLGRSVPTYQVALFVDPVKDQGWRSQGTILGTNNVAEAMTKAVDRWALDRHMAAVSCILIPSLALKSLAHLHELSRLHLDRGVCEDTAALPIR